MPEPTPVDMTRYIVHMESKFGPLERVDVLALAKTFVDRWCNQTLCQVNDSLVRLGVVEGEYHWHQHAEEDEFLYVIEGRLIIEIDGHDSIELTPARELPSRAGRAGDADLWCGQSHASGERVVLGDAS